MTMSAPEPLPPAVEKALVQHYERFLGWIERQVGSRASAEELLQSAFVRAVEKGVPADDEEGTVNWFYRVLRNAVVDHHRTKGAETRALGREADASGADRLDPELHANVCRCVHDVLPALKPEYAEIVRRVDLEETAVADVARETGISANNAAVRLHRARQSVKKHLEKMCGACSTHGCLDCSCHGPKAELAYERR